MARKVNTRVDLAHALKATKATAASALTAAQAIHTAERANDESVAARRAAYADHAPTVAAWVTGGRGRAAGLAIGITGVPSRKADRSDEQEAAFVAAQQTVSRWARAGLLMASRPSTDADVREALIKLGNALTIDECQTLANLAAWTPKADQSVKQVRALLTPAPKSGPKSGPKAGPKSGPKSAPKAPSGTPADIAAAHLAAAIAAYEFFAANPAVLTKAQAESLHAARVKAQEARAALKIDIKADDVARKVRKVRKTA